MARHGGLVYTLSAYVFDGQALEAEYLHLFSVLRQENFALLRVFHGRATLVTYLTLTVSNLLALHVLALFARDANRAWQAFERFFRKDTLHVLTSVFPAQAVDVSENGTPDDRYQDICLLLIEQDYHRIKAYDGRGPFAAYLRSIVRRLCVDMLRREQGRRRLPDKIKEYPAIEQDVFKHIYWESQAPEEGRRTLVACATQHSRPSWCSRACSRRRRQPPNRLCVG